MNKILLSTAATVLVLGFSSIPSSANIELSLGGEAKLTASNDDRCFTSAGTNDLEAVLEAASGDAIDATDEGTFNTYIAGLTVMGHNAAVVTDNDNDNVVDFDGPNNDGQNPDNTPVPNLKYHESTIGFEDDPCAGANEALKWGFGKEITIGASGTLANGLEVSFSDKIDLTDVDKEEGSFELVLGSAVGTLTFKDGAPSAVDAAILNKFDVDITGNKVGPGVRGRLPTETSGSAGMGILWQAPSVGDLDLYVSWAPNSGNAGLDNAAYENTFAIGAVMNTSALTIGAGYEAASANAAGACSLAIAAGGLNHTVASGSIVERSAQSIVDSVYGGSECGDQTLTYVGVEFAAGAMTFGAGYSNLETDGADTAIYGIAMDTSVGAYDVGLTYRTNEKTYVYNKVKDEQTVLGVSLGTSLGDGVDLGLQFSTNEVDLAAEAAGNGKTNNYFAEASLKVGF